MSIEVAFLSLFVRKDVLEARFPGGVAGFRERFPCHAEDNWLFRISSMEGREFAETLERLQEAGIEPERDIAVAEMMNGPQHGADGIAFVATGHEDGPFPAWVAAASEEPDAPLPRKKHAAALTKRLTQHPKPKLEVVREKPDSVADSDEGPETPDAVKCEEAPPATAQTPPPPRASATLKDGQWSILLRQQHDDHVDSTLTASIQADGHLVLYGFDFGEAPRKFWGREDYEYWLTVKAECVPRVLLELLAERFDSDSDYREWLDARGIENEFSSWSS